MFGPLPGLLNYVGSSTDYRTLTDPVAMNSQVNALPKGRAASLAFLTAFVEDIKASGLVQRLIDQSGRKGIVVPPKAP